MKTVAAFALGFGAGMVCLAAVLWSTGSLVTHAEVRRALPETVRFKEPEFDRGERKQPTAIPPPISLPQTSPGAPGSAPTISPTPAPTASDRPGSLGMPIAGVDPHTLKSNFSETRGGHAHEALDIMAARGTPVLAVAEGNVVKLFTSKQGGLTVYQFDDSATWCYYYAHLNRYAPALKEGMLLRKGDVLGYVGSTGDASPDAPHLHFAVFQLGPEKHWWQGTAIDPLPLLR
jgi:murein DD-endopeptidase MepM/ murein hydrolase activator NlpD